MGMDKNTTIGFVLIGMLLIAMFYFNSKSRLAFEGEQKRIADSIAKINPPKKPEAVNLKIDTASGMTIQTNTAVFGITASQPSLSVVENELFKATFSSKGGQIKSVELKKFKKSDGKPVVLNNSDFNKISYRLNVSQNKSSAIEDINFNALPVKQDGKNKVITFEAADSTGKKIVHEYTITDNDYMIGFKLKANGADFLFSQNLINFTWQVECPQIEQDHAYELTQSHF